MDKEYDAKRQILDEISPSFCLAKWLQVTIDLAHGTNHSCHHPKRHKIPLDELKDNPSALHNTEFKKEVRKQMLAGIRPRECDYCWQIEDADASNPSDRYIKSLDSWSFPHLDKVKNINWDEDINPTYVEVIFDSICNFSCAYCSADISTQIMAEMNKFGPYPIMEQHHRLPEEDLVTYREDENPYIKAFWEWIPSINEDLEYLRVSGGEPLLSQNTFKLFNFFSNNPNQDITLSINSNFCVPTPIIDKFLESFNHLIESKKIGKGELYISIDTSGKQAEYIRCGLNYEELLKNIKKAIKTLTQMDLIFMCTVNILSITGLKDLLKQMLEIKKLHPSTVFDVSYLNNPHYLRANLADKELIATLEDSLSFMKSNLAPKGKAGFSDYEIKKLQRIISWAKIPTPDLELSRGRADLFGFLSEYDKRKGLDFKGTFPEMVDFFKVCQKEHDKRK